MSGNTSTVNISSNTSFGAAVASKADDREVVAGSADAASVGTGSADGRESVASLVTTEILPFGNLGTEGVLYFILEWIKHAEGVVRPRLDSFQAAYDAYAKASLANADKATLDQLREKQTTAYKSAEVYLKDKNPVVYADLSDLRKQVEEALSYIATVQEAIGDHRGDPAGRLFGDPAKFISALRPLDDPEQEDKRSDAFAIPALEYVVTRSSEDDESPEVEIRLAMGPDGRPLGNIGPAIRRVTNSLSFHANMARKGATIGQKDDGTYGFTVYDKKTKKSRVAVADGAYHEIIEAYLHLVECFCARVEDPSGRKMEHGPHAGKVRLMPQLMATYETVKAQGREELSKRIAAKKELADQLREARDARSVASGKSTPQNRSRLYRGGAVAGGRRARKTAMRAKAPPSTPQRTRVVVQPGAPVKKAKGPTPYADAISGHKPAGPSPVDSALNLLAGPMRTLNPNAVEAGLKGLLGAETAAALLTMPAGMQMEALRPMVESMIASTPAPTASSAPVEAAAADADDEAETTKPVRHHRQRSKRGGRKPVQKTRPTADADGWVTNPTNPRSAPVDESATPQAVDAPKSGFAELADALDSDEDEATEDEDADDEVVEDAVRGLPTADKPAPAQVESAEAQELEGWE